ncbi:MAG: hypothetical protein GY804_05465 [Alphaproteobacteria bacterium]|nr:hypothetical protein [Alphaproteobacteria bacterium]
MDTLENLSKRIKTTNDLRSIVSTMKALAAASINQYDKASASLVEYHKSIELGLHVSLLENDTSLVEEKNSNDKPTITLVIGTDHGLVGRFNKEVSSRAVNALREKGVAPGEAIIVAAGKRVNAILESAGEKAETVFHLPSSVNGLVPAARNILVRIEELCREHETDKVLIFANKKTKKSLAKVAETQLLPVSPEYLIEISQRKWESRCLPMHTMEQSEIFSAFIRQLLFNNICKALAQSLLSEQASRLAAMQAAEKNIDEHLENMNRIYQQRRQAAITEELLDVVGGSEILNKKLAEKRKKAKKAAMAEAAATA